MNFTNQTQSQRVQKAFAARSNNLQMKEIKIQTSENSDVTDFLTNLQAAYVVTKKTNTLQFS